jgi:hypothetical protein
MTYNEKLTRIVLPKVKAHIKIGDKVVFDRTVWKVHKIDIKSNYVGEDFRYIELIYWDGFDNNYKLVPLEEYKWIKVLKEK